MALAYLPDIESDMSVLHRIEDVRAMPAQRFIDLAMRLPAYSGVMRRRLEKIQMDELEDGTTPEWRSAASSAGAASGAPKDRTVPGDSLEALANDPDFAGVEFVKGGATDGR